MRKTNLVFVGLLTILAIAVASCGSVKSETKSGTKELEKKEAKPVPKNLLNGHEWVDLGLPSGTLWATCNVGANQPTEFGDYFAWAETASKETCDDKNYKYYDHGLTKYCDQPRRGKDGFADGLTEIQAEDDAASVNWGEGWRIPTHDEVNELIGSCTIKQMEKNGVWGITFVGPNGNSIFMPLAGYCNQSGRGQGKGYYGYYGTRTLYIPKSSSDRHWVWYLRLDGGPGLKPEAYTQDIQREIGLTVRPVCSPK